MIKKFISGVMCLSMLSGCVAFADSLNEINPDYANHTVSVSGSLDDGAGVRVTLQVLNPGILEEDIDSVTPETFMNVFSYAAETDADANGDFLFESFDFGEKSGYYSVRVMRSDGQLPQFYPNTFIYVSSDFEKDLLTALKEGNGESFILENISVLTPNYQCFENYSTEVQIEILKLSTKSKIESFDDASKSVNRGCFFVTGEDLYFEDCIFPADTPSIYFKDFSQKEKDDVIKNVTGATISEKTESFEENCFFKALHSAGGNKALENIIINNEKWHGIDLSDYKALKSKKSVNAKIAEDKPNTITELKKIIKSASESGGSSGGGGVSSGAVAGRGGSGSVSFSPVDTQPPVQEATPPANAVMFTDISGYEWAKEAIEELYKKGIVNGTSDKVFSPGRNITRAEFVKLICTAFLGNSKEYEGNFADVSESDWFAPYVASAFDSGVVKGISETEFGSSLNITRQDMAVMIFNASKLAAGESRMQFADFDEISDYAKEAVLTMNSLGIINGRGNGEFCPKENATRAEAAQMIYKALKVLSGGDGV
ncbi:MAG: S-layer homology domain-containing protein [Clostridia bacterium]|nr:S-layer homology domain-containing protein [Clostridia bacterium]